jgi:hypothetical protein
MPRIIVYQSFAEREPHPDEGRGTRNLTCPGQAKRA